MKTKRLPLAASILLALTATQAAAERLAVVTSIQQNGSNNSSELTQSNGDSLRFLSVQDGSENRSVITQTGGLGNEGGVQQIGSRNVFSGSQEGGINVSAFAKQEGDDNTSKIIQFRANEGEGYTTARTKQYSSGNWARVEQDRGEQLSIHSEQGWDNRFKGYQMWGSDHQMVSYQTRSWNTASLEQLQGVGSYTHSQQDGERNSVEVLQDQDLGGSRVVSQQSDDNKARIDQHNPDKNDVLNLQLGDYNKAILEQWQGNSNTIENRQFGDSNEIVIEQRGQSNSIDTNQSGGLNRGFVNQNGDSSNVKINQSGEFNESNILQGINDATGGGGFNFASITQHGIGLVGAPNKATIKQFGSNYIATIMQSGGSGNMAQITQN